MTPKAVIRHRVVVVEKIHHVGFDGNPSTVLSVGYNHWLDKAETPFIKEVVIGDDWRTIDYSEMAPIWGLVVQNKGAERIEVDLGTKFEVRPGQSMRGCPIGVTKLRVRTVGGAGLVRVTVFAK